MDGASESRILNLGLISRPRARAALLIGGAQLAALLIGGDTAAGGQGGEAPGWPGASPIWSPATNQFLGTAFGPDSRVVFTGHDGILGEVFFPSPDTPSLVDAEFLVGDAAHTFTDEEKVATNSSATLVDGRSLTWEVVNTAKNGRYALRKTIFTDPGRDALVERVTFTALQGQVGDYRLYFLLHPALDNAGQATDCSVAAIRSVRTVIAVNHDTGFASSLVTSLPWQVGSCGFVGASDGWTDLKGGTGDNTLDWAYGTASNGNVAATVLLDTTPFASATSVTFSVVLGFGATADAASTAAAGTLAANPGTLQAQYQAGWKAYCDSLDPQGGTADQLYYAAAMAIKAAQDKERGGIVAGLGNPWGDSNYGPLGYHLVWARDLYKFASALIVAGDRASADKALTFLLAHQEEPSGRFPQNSWCDGSPAWNNTQLDEVAFPIVLAEKLGRDDPRTYVQNIRPAADYLVAHGPRTQQERWEEAAGFSPATIAAEVAGLVAASAIADANGDAASRDRYLEVADFWQAMVEAWTFTTSGPLTGGSYYERIDDWGDPEDGHPLTIANGGGTFDERSIIDSSFTELVRHGVKAATDPHVVASLRSVDATIRFAAESGVSFYRYNHDGYGESRACANFSSAGLGRPWPILTAERGEALVDAQDLGGARTYLGYLRGFASGEFISEQIWDDDSCGPSGRPTRSMRPLNWAEGDYITLLASIARGTVADRLDLVHQRYVSAAFVPARTPVDADPRGLAQGRALSIFYKGALANGAALRVQATTTPIPLLAPMIRRADGYWQATLTVPVDISTGTGALGLRFTDGTSWDGPFALTVAATAHTPRRNDADPWPVDRWPYVPVRGQAVTIYYDASAGPLAGLRPTMHWGVNGWTAVQDTAMTRVDDRWWAATVRLDHTSGAPARYDTYRLDAAFSSGGTWDNNGGADYHFGVSPR